MVIHYFVIVEDGDEDSRIKYFNTLTDAIDFAELMEQQGNAVSVEVEFQSLQLWWTSQIS